MTLPPDPILERLEARTRELAYSCVVEVEGALVVAYRPPGGPWYVTPWIRATLVNILNDDCEPEKALALRREPEVRFPSGEIMVMIPEGIRVTEEVDP